MRDCKKCGTVYDEFGEKACMCGETPSDKPACPKCGGNVTTGTHAVMCKPPQEASGVREFKFKIKRRDNGEAWVIWEGDPIKDSEPGSFHVIEKSAYDALKAKYDALELLPDDAEKSRQIISLCAEIKKLQAEVAELRQELTGAKTALNMEKIMRCKFQVDAKVYEKERDALKARLEKSERDGQAWMFSYKQVMSNGERVIAERDRFQKALEEIAHMDICEHNINEAMDLAKEALGGGK